jgi:hypothetical protein
VTRIYVSMLYNLLLGEGVFFKTTVYRNGDKSGSPPQLVFTSVDVHIGAETRPVALRVHANDQRVVLSSWANRLVDSKHVDLKTDRRAPWLRKDQLMLYESDTYIAKLGTHVIADFHAVMCHYWMTENIAGIQARCETCPIQLQCLARST